MKNRYQKLCSATLRPKKHVLQNNAPTPENLTNIVKLYQTSEEPVSCLRAGPSFFQDSEEKKNRFFIFFSFRNCKFVTFHDFYFVAYCDPAPIL